MNCECCNYKTENKTSFQKHLKTNKHLKNAGKEKEKGKEVENTNDDKYETVLKTMTEEEYNDWFKSFRETPTPEFNKEETMKEILIGGEQLLYNKVKNNEGDKDEKVLDGLLRYYHEKKYDINSYQNIDKNKNLVQLSVLIFVYNNYIELVNKYEEFRKLGSIVADEYKILETENILFRMKLKRAMEEIEKLKASHNQSE